MTNDLVFQCSSFWFRHSSFRQRFVTDKIKLRLRSPIIPFARTMSYLLPCPACGNKLTVVAGQAGQLVQCTCGADVEVPTIRGLRELEQISSVAESPSRWTSRHSVAFLGLLIAAGALAFSLYLHLRAPVFDPGGYENEVQTASPEQSWEHWTGNLRHGPRMRSQDDRPRRDRAACGERPVRGTLGMGGLWSGSAGRRDRAGGVVWDAFRQSFPVHGLRFKVQYFA